jgi:ABC-type lipoprotein release transport system permease subunit
MITMFKMAFRDLQRNKRRTFFSCLALGMGVGLLLLMASFIAGEMRGSMENGIRLESGHLQVRAKTYDENKNSLQFEDLIANPGDISEKIAGLAPVSAATPRLFASGILTDGDETSGVRVMGFDPDSAASTPFREGMQEGEYLKTDDRSGILVGREMASKLKLKLGDNVNVMINTSDGEMDEQTFSIRGIFSTHTPGFDEFTVLMPLAKVQAITKADNHASIIFVTVKNIDDTDSVAAALKTDQLQVLTYKELNSLVLDTEQFARGYMVLIYIIVLAITAAVVVNTLIMSVYERTREIGILAAIGMKGPRIMLLFFIESIFLAIGGILIGLIIGGTMVYFASTFGFYIGNYGVSGFLVGETIYAYLTFNDAATLVLLAFFVTLIGALYPAVMAARMEPVEAMRDAKN